MSFSAEYRFHFVFELPLCALPRAHIHISFIILRWQNPSNLTMKAYFQRALNKYIFNFGLCIFVCFEADIAHTHSTFTEFRSSCELSQRNPTINYTLKQSEIEAIFIQVTYFGNRTNYIIWVGVCLCVLADARWCDRFLFVGKKRQDL